MNKMVIAANAAAAAAATSAVREARANILNNLVEGTFPPSREEFLEAMSTLPSLPWGDEFEWAIARAAERARSTSELSDAAARQAWAAKAAGDWVALCIASEVWRSAYESLYDWEMFPIRANQFREGRYISK